MSTYAIAMLRDTDGEIKIRLFSSDRGMCLDVLTRDIPYYISKYGEINNLEIKKNTKELKWKQGVAERYPIIDMQVSSHRNIKAITVLGVEDTGIEKFYKICNCRGQLAILKSKELIAFGKENGITNCKIVKKRGTDEFISAIEGELEAISIKPIYRLNNETHHLEISLAVCESDTFSIAEYMDGRLIEGVKSIDIKPAKLAENIKHLVLNKHIIDISSSIFTSMPNLETIEVKAENALVYDDAFIALKRLKSVKFKSIKALGMAPFKGLKDLVSVDCEEPLKWISSNCFAGCESFNGESVLKEGLQYIGTKAFDGNKKFRKIVLPSTLTFITENAFDGNINLKDVDIRSDVFEVSIKAKADENKGLFRRLNNIRVTLNRYAALTADKFGDNVTIVRREETSTDKSIAKKIQKSAIVGWDLDVNEIYSAADDVASIINISKQEDIEKIMVESVNELLNNTGITRTEVLKSIGGFKVRFKVFGSPGLKSARKMKNMGRYLMLTGKKINIYPLDRKLIVNILNRCTLNLAVITPIEMTRANIVSVDMADNGEMRFIYRDKSGNVEVKTSKEFT